MMESWVTKEAEPETKKLFRIVLLSWWLFYFLTLLPSHAEFWGPRSFVPPAPFDPHQPTHYLTRILSHSVVAPYYGVVIGLNILFLILGICGFYPRLCTILIAVLTRNLLEAAWVTTDGGTNLAELFLIYLVFINSSETPTPRPTIASKFGTALSNTAFQLARFQLVLVYATAGMCKMSGPLWRNGTALFYILQSEYYSHPLWGKILLEHPVLLSLFTHATILFQLSFPALIWAKSFRPYLIGLGTVFHLSIAVVMGLTHFGMMMTIAYVVFFPNSWSFWIFQLVKKRAILLSGRSLRPIEG